MTGWELLAKWAGLSAPALREKFVEWAAAFPDAAPKINETIARLDDAVTAEVAMQAVGFIATEAGQIAQGNFSGQDNVENLS